MRHSDGRWAFTDGEVGWSQWGNALEPISREAGCDGGMGTYRWVNGSSGEEAVIDRWQREDAAVAEWAFRAW